MKLRKTRTKLEDARVSYDFLSKSEDAVQFRTAFGALINNSRAITYAMQKEGSKDSQFMSWYSEKQDEMKNDKLIRFVHDARIEDFHKGSHQLHFSSTANLSNINPGNILLSSPEAISSDGTWSFSIHGDGISTKIKKGTPQEKRVMLNQNFLSNTTITLLNPPATHLGVEIKDNTPISISKLIIKYFENLVFQAEKMKS